MESLDVLIEREYNLFLDDNEEFDDIDLADLTHQRYCVLCGVQYCLEDGHQRINEIFQRCDVIRVFGLATDVRKLCLKNNNVKEYIIKKCPNNTNKAIIFLRNVVYGNDTFCSCCLL